MDIRAFSNNEGSASGTTTASYAVAKSIDMTGFRNCLILIKNSDPSSTMYYKVDSYANTDGLLSNPEVTQTSIAAAGTAAVVLDGKTRAKYVVSVIDNSGHCAYSIEYIQGN
ncbi:hypothetical protein [Methanoregula sp.]|uniref:hypothetical protein n=1 Tax=Methanoregula sp. TaxID=2052170 RepID=UPI0035690CA0